MKIFVGLDGTDPLDADQSIQVINGLEEGALTVGGHVGTVIRKE